MNAEYIQSEDGKVQVIRIHGKPHSSNTLLIRTPAGVWWIDEEFEKVDIDSNENLDDIFDKLKFFNPKA